MSSYISSPTASTTSLPAFNFDSSTSAASISNSKTLTTTTTPAASSNNVNNTKQNNFWDFDSYSRVFLHERKAIEKEKSEWQVQVELRQEILSKSATFYHEKYLNLSQRIEECLETERKLEEESEESESLERQLMEANLRVNQLKCLQKYFGKLEVLIDNGIGNEKEFEENLLTENWKESLDSLINLITTGGNSEQSKTESEVQIHHGNNNNWSNLEKRTQEIISNRLKSFHSALSTKISIYIESLGWPSIKTYSEESVEIITKLQELLTYGEALYLLSQRSGADLTSIISLSHPISAFIEPLKIRFNYHFSGDRPTNRIDRPDWYFANLLSFIRENCSFFREFVLPCWRLRNIDDFFTEGPVQLADSKTQSRIFDIKTTTTTSSSSASNNTQDLIILHLIEYGKFYKTLNEEFGYALDEKFERKFNETFCEGAAEMEEFINCELERIKRAYREEIEGTDFSKKAADSKDKDSRTTTSMTDPSTVVLKFLSLFNETTVVPYSYIPNIRLRSHLLHRVQAWLLESFYNKLQFECSPLHSSESDILHDMNMAKALEIICKVLRDEFGESLECIELSAAPELHEIIGYDPSQLPGTCFNRAITEFQAICTKLNAYIFNWVMGRFLKHAILHSNSMNYCKVSDHEHNHEHDNIEEEIEDIPMSENFRVSIVNLERALNFVSPYLNASSPSTSAAFKTQLIEKLAEFMYKSVLLGNFFTDPGVRRFAQDLQYLKDFLSTHACFQANNNNGSSSDFHLLNINEAFLQVSQAVELLKIKEKDPTAPFDSIRLLKAIKDRRREELKRFLEMTRLTHISIEDLPHIFASRKY